MALYCRSADGGGERGKCPAPCKKEGKLLSGRKKCTGGIRWGYMSLQGNVRITEILT